MVKILKKVEFYTYEKEEYKPLALKEAREIRDNTDDDNSYIVLLESELKNLIDGIRSKKIKFDESKYDDGSVY